jgi:uncharacterized protein YjbI with pentapeptide repeats
MLPEELQKVLKEHEKWLSSHEQGHRADLTETNLSGANLRGADLREADLSGANLSGANLSGANLILADLREADLGGANLRGADLRGAYLGGADLSEANLSEANLSGANLSGADLNRADLRGANLSGANLSDANLRDVYLDGANLDRTDLRRADLLRANLGPAHLNGAMLAKANVQECALYSTTFANVDFREVDGIEKMQHRGPSTIGVDTLRASGGQIPEVFLRGCGLSDWEIIVAGLYRPDLNTAQVNDLIYKLFELRTENPIQYFSCFISYSHDDKRFAKKLHDQLQCEGIRCWLDERQMLPGDDIHEQVDRGIRLWDKVLLCCSEKSLTSWWVDSEINRAFDKEQALMRERKKKIRVLIPLDLDGYLFGDQWENGKKTEVKSRVAADFRKWEIDECVFDEQMRRLVKALRADDAGREPPPKPLI